MQTTQNFQLTHTTIFIPDLANHFYQAKKAEGLSPFTLTFYRQQLAHFLKYCEAQSITQITEVTPVTLREFMLWHEETGHNPGGIHAAYRTVKVFLKWCDLEIEPDNWKNPIRKVKAPRVDLEPLEPARLDDISKLVDICKTDSFLDLRDKALFLFLLDTGTRARECTSLDLQDIDIFSGEITIRQGKGGKPRTVFSGQKTRRAIRAYLKKRGGEGSPALWITGDRERLSYGGLRGLVTRRAEQAGIETPALHSFRRAFAISMLRAGTDLITLARLMGHSDLTILQRYLKQIPDDLRAAHVKGSPVDTLKI